MKKLLFLVLILFSKSCFIFAEATDITSVLPDILDDKDTQLYKAVQEEKFDKVQELLKQGADPSSIYEAESGELCDQLNTLHLAIDYKNSELVKLFLEHGADPNKRTGRYGQTPLVLATDCAPVDCVRALLEHGADPNMCWEDATGKYGDSYSPLLNAVRNNNLEVVQLLLEFNADPRRGCESWGPHTRERSVLEVACRQGNTAIIKALLEKYSLDDPDDREELASALRGACQEKADNKKEIQPVLDVFLNKIGDPQKVNVPLLVMAAQLSDLELARTVLEKTADPNIPDKEGNCALHYAVFNGNIELIKLLLEHKADPNKRTRDGLDGGMSPLDIIIQDSLTDTYRITANKYRKKLPREEIAELLLKNGADPNSFTEHDFSNITALHRAITNNDLALVKILLKYGADVTMRTKTEGYTPLHLAVFRADLALIEVLLENGACINDVTSDGSTVAELAALRGRITILKHLLKYSDQLDKEALKRILMSACENAHLGVFKALLDVVSPELLLCVDADGRTLLHKAADRYCKNYPNEYSRNDALKIVTLLLDKNIPVDSQDNDGDTPLHLVVRNGGCSAQGLQEADKQIIKLLVEHKANVNLINKQGCLPLHIALRGQFDRKYPESINLLITDATPLNHKDQYGNTPLLYAQTDSSLKLLLDKGADVFVKNNDNETIAHTAGRWQGVSADAYKLLLNKINKKTMFNERDKLTRTPLCATLEFENVTSAPKAQLLIDAGADVKLGNCNWAPIHKAAVYNKDLVKAMLDKGADINQKDWEGNTPLFWAVKNVWGYFNGIKNDRVDIIELLLDNSALINHQNNSGDSVLMYCVDEGSVKMMKFLLEKGADTRLKNKKGRTVLHLATRKWDNAKMVRVILEKDKKIINELDNEGKTALDLAQDSTIKKLLIKNGAQNATQLAG